MKIHLEQIKANNNFMDKTKQNSGFVDSGFVKTCDELDIGIKVSHQLQALIHTVPITKIPMRQVHLLQMIVKIHLLAEFRLCISRQMVHLHVMIRGTVITTTVLTRKFSFLFTISLKSVIKKQFHFHHDFKIKTYFILKLP